MTIHHLLDSGEGKDSGNWILEYPVESRHLNKLNPALFLPSPFSTVPNVMNIKYFPKSDSLSLLPGLCNYSIEKLTDWSLEKSRLCLSNKCKLHFTFPRGQKLVIDCLISFRTQKWVFYFQTWKNFKAESLPKNRNLSIRNVSDDI